MLKMEKDHIVEILLVKYTLAKMYLGTNISLNHLLIRNVKYKCGDKTF